MSFLEKALSDVVFKATKEYINIAQSDPKVESIEDETARGEFLDELLEAQKNERKELWDKLYNLQNERTKEGRHDAFSDQVEITAYRKQLLTLMHEHRDLSTEISNEMEKIDILNQPNEDILEIEFKEQLEKQIGQYEESLKFIQEQLQQTTLSLRHEKKVLDECKDVHDALTSKLQELSEQLNVQTYPNQLRDEQVLLEKKYKQDIIDLSDFVDEYFPPHPVDNAGPLGDECELKIVLEQLMNEAFTAPDNPYIKLIPGTYWSPYVQTLLKAGIIKYHPEDATLVRLEDYRL